MNFDRATLEALNRVRVDPGLVPFREYLGRRRDEARDRLENTQDVHQMSRAQGAALEARQIIEDIQAALTRLEGTARKPFTRDTGQF